MGDAKIGTTGRGIGPAYEDKIARRAIRVQDLFYPERFAAKLEPVLEFHNFVLTQYFKRDPVPFAKTRDDTLALAAELKPMVADVAALLQSARTSGQSLLFEGAQGALLDIDHGTYPYVTSSNCLAGAAAPGAGVGPEFLDYVLGIVKAYTTRVGTGPFPTELTDDVGAGLAKRGNEFGSVTGRPRRCGWLDIPGARPLVPAERRRRRLHHQARRARRDARDPDLHRVHGERESGCAAAIGRRRGRRMRAASTKRCPDGARARSEPRTIDALPRNARAYLERIETLTSVPIAMVSTGPDRAETILLHHPFH